MISKAQLPGNCTIYSHHFCADDYLITCGQIESGTLPAPHSSRKYISGLVLAELSHQYRI